MCVINTRRADPANFGVIVELVAAKPPIRYYLRLKKGSIAPTIEPFLFPQDLFLLLISIICILGRVVFWIELLINPVPIIRARLPL